VKILLVEDDEFVAELLASALSSQHYLVERATDGQEGWELAEAFEYDLILLDLMLPKLDGLTFCQQRRQQGDRTPILLMTGHDTKTNKVMGLDAGADDYVIKPFDLQEILARIRALLRRGNLTITPIIEWENLRFDPNNCEVTYNGQFLHLTPKEYALLELFLRNTQRIFSQSALLDHLWSFEEPPSENTVRAHIKSLRQKLKKAGAATDFIETVYGLGYRLKLKEAAAHHRQAETPETSPPTPQSTSTAQRSQSEISPEIAALWERFQEKYSDRLTVIEQAVTALLDGRLSEDLRQQASRRLTP
jgi:DNA-binding response OmpR family regulator